jgi:hypothetical protein
MKKPKKSFELHEERRRGLQIHIFKEEDTKKRMTTSLAK